MMSKEKLTSIPRSKAPARQRSPESVDQPAAPDLSRIASGLRPLAVPIGELQFHPKNPRRHSEQHIEAFRARLQQFGQYRPAIISRRTGQAVVIAGNGMLAAALAEGWTHLAAEPMDLTADEEDFLAIADNETEELGEPDAVNLRAILDRLKTAPLKINDRCKAMLEKLRAEKAPKPPAEKKDQPDQPPPQDEGEKRTVATCPACNHEFTLVKAA